MRHNTMKYSPIATVLAAAALALSLAACGSATSQAEENSNGHSGESDAGDSQSQSGDDDTQKPPPDAEVTAVTVTKSGGYGGMSETLEISEDGTWSYVKNRMAPQDGELTEEELTSVWESAADKEIADQAEEPKEDCADIPIYEIEIAYGDDELTTQTDACGTAPNAPFDEIVKTVSDTTPI